MDAINQLGEVGHPFLDDKRMIFMGLSVFLQCLGLIFFIVGMSAWSTDEETVLRTYWAYSESAAQNELVSLYGLRTEVNANLNNDDTSGHTSYEDCDDLDYCQNCSDGGKAAFGMCLMGFFTLCPLVLTTGLRMIKKMDSKGVKLTNVIITSMVLLWSIIAVWSFSGQCVDFLPIQLSTTGYKYGPGYNCIVCNIVWMLYALYVHVYTPCSGPSSMKEPLDEEDSPGEDGYVAPEDKTEQSNEV